MDRESSRMSDSLFRWTSRSFLVRSRFWLTEYFDQCQMGKKCVVLKNHGDGAFPVVDGLPIHLQVERRLRGGFGVRRWSTELLFSNTVSA